MILACCLFLEREHFKFDEKVQLARSSEVTHLFSDENIRWTVFAPVCSFWTESMRCVLGAAVIEADSNPAVEDRAVDTEDEPEVTKQVWSLTQF